MKTDMHSAEFERHLSDLALDPVADEGFSERVMQQIPQKPRHRQALPVLALIAGGVLAGVQLSGNGWFTAATQSMQAGQLGNAGLAVWAVASVLALGAALWALLEQA